MWVGEGAGEWPSPRLADDRQPCSQPQARGARGNCGLASAAFQAPPGRWAVGYRVPSLRTHIRGQRMKLRGLGPAVGGPWGLGGTAWARVSLSTGPILRGVVEMLREDPISSAHHRLTQPCREAQWSWYLFSCWGYRGHGPGHTVAQLAAEPWPLSPGLPLPSQWAGSWLEGRCPGTPPPLPSSPRSLGGERRGKVASQTRGCTTRTMRGRGPGAQLCLHRARAHLPPVPPGRCGPA